MIMVIICRNLSCATVVRADRDGHHAVQKRIATENWHKSLLSLYGKMEMNAIVAQLPTFERRTQMDTRVHSWALVWLKVNEGRTHESVLQDINRKRIKAHEACIPQIKF